MEKRQCIVPCLVLITMLATGAWAYDIEIWEGHPIEIHGSFGQGAIITTENNWLDLNTKDGTVSFNDFVLNGNIVLTGSLNFGMQLLSRDFGPMGNNQVILDWGYFDYAWKDWMGFRLGRIKKPHGLHTETWDLDLCRTTVLLPPMYSAEFRDATVTGDGLALYGQISLGKWGSLGYLATLTDMTLDKDGAVRFNMEAGGMFRSPDDWSIDYATAMKLDWETPVEGLRLAVTYANTQNIEADLKLYNPNMWRMPVHLDTHVEENMVYSVEYLRGDWGITGEFKYGHRYLSMREIMRFHALTLFGAWYVQGDYRWNDYLASAVGYGITYNDWNRRGDHDQTRKVAYAAMRADITDYWMFKLEAQWVDGMVGIYPKHNSTRWGFDKRKSSYFMFLAKTTLYF